MPVRTLSPARVLDPAWLLGMSDSAPVPETHPNLGGVFDEAHTGGVYDQSKRNGTYDQSRTGGRYDQSVTGGEVL